MLFEACKIKPGDVFGLQEIITQIQKKESAGIDRDSKVMPPVQRKFRVKAVTTCTLIYIQNHKIETCKFNTNLELFVVFSLD